MGKLNQGTFGAFSGKVGNLIGSSWRGIPVLRIKPASVANPRTEGQVHQRNKFTVVTQFLQAQAEFVRVGYKFYQNKMTARNAATSYLLENAITGSAPDFEIDYANALLSRGTVKKPEGYNVSVLAGVTTVAWTDNSNQSNGLSTDISMLVAYSPLNRESVIMLEGTATRAATTQNVTIPTHFVGDELEFFLAFRKADGSAVSDSVYVGSLTGE